MVLKYLIPDNLLHQFDESAPLQRLVRPLLDLVLHQELWHRGQVKDHEDGSHPEVDAVSDLEIRI